MARLLSLPKRLILGRALRSDRLQEQLLPKGLALPVFASDALSSVAYAPEEILVTLSLAGIAAYSAAIWIGVIVAIVMLTVVASYRQNVHAYPSGGGDFEVATVNLGGNPGLTVGSALLVDYVLTVAVSVSSGVANIGSAVPFVGSHAVEFAVGVVIVLTAINLRGIRESGVAFAIPTYAFMVGVFAMVIWGFTRVLMGVQLRAPSAGFHVHPQSTFTGLAYAFLLLRAFSSGSAALTGVEAISNGVPAFRKPKSKNAATTLLMMGLIAVSMLLGIIGLALVSGVKVVDPGLVHTSLSGEPANYVQATAIAQIAQAAFSNFPPGFYYVAGVTGIILVLAANTAFNGFPVLGSILAQNRYLPRQLHTRGDRLAFSNGILFLAAFACVLIIGFQAQTTRLIQLYIVGVFVSFTLSQTGMVRHWTRHLKTETDPAVRRRMYRSRIINGFGGCMTAVVLVVVLITKFLLGAWIAIAAMVVIFMLMKAIHKHYVRISAELEPPDLERAVLPARNHGVVLVSKLHLPTLRALAYARATRPDTLTAVTVNVDEDDTRALQADWERRSIQVPLAVIDSPYREITRPVLEYVRNIRRQSPRDVVTVFIPEYVVGRWWEQLLHNQSALRLKSRLLFQPGVMVTNVPWQLQSIGERGDTPKLRSYYSPGDVRRGVRDRARRRDNPPDSERGRPAG